MDVSKINSKSFRRCAFKSNKSIQISQQNENLVLAGGVALNCVANGRILKESKFKNIWVQPASGDAGGALGAALTFYYKHNVERKFQKRIKIV